MIWFFKRHCIHTMNMCVYIYIAYHEYCMLRIHMCDCVFAFFIEIIRCWYRVHTALHVWLVWVEGIWYPNVHGAPRFGTASSGFGYFGNHQRFSIQYSSKFNFLSASIMPYMVHPSMLNVGYPWHRVPFSVPSNPNGSSYEPKISTLLMIFRKIWSARILLYRNGIWNVTCVLVYIFE